MNKNIVAAKLLFFWNKDMFVYETLLLVQQMRPFSVSAFCFVNKEKLLKQLIVGYGILK